MIEGLYDIISWNSVFRLDKASLKSINRINALFVNEDFFLNNEVVITLFIFGKKESGILILHIFYLKIFFKIMDYLANKHIKK